MKKNTTSSSSYRKIQTELEGLLQKRLKVQRNIWSLIVLAKIFSLLSLFLNYYRERF
jgi:hypothetical protein